MRRYSRCSKYFLGSSVLQVRVQSFAVRTTMNLLIAVPWDQDSGGVASVVGNLAGYFQARGHKVIFLHPGQTNFLQPKKTKLGFDGVEMNLRVPFSRESSIRSILSFVAFLPVTLFRLHSFLLKSRIRLVNIHYPGDALIYFAILRWLGRIKLVVSVHGADLFPGGKPQLQYSRAIRMILHAADTVIAPSKAFLSDVLRIFPSLREKGMCIHNGVYLKDLGRGSKHNFAAATDRYILSLAVQNEKKGLDVLVTAFGTLCASEPGLRLKLAGDGPLRKDLEQLADSLHIRDRVDFLGWQCRNEVTALLGGCEVFVMPSRSEPFGIAIIEAMACHKPVVACAVGGIPEIVENGKNGILVEPDNPAALADAIENLLKSPERQRAIAENGYMTAHTRFGSESMGSRYERMFAKMLDSGAYVRESEHGIP